MTATFPIKKVCTKPGTLQYDVGLPPRNAAECAGLFEHAELAVQPGAGHFPWLDDPAWFTRTLAAVLG